MGTTAQYSNAAFTLLGQTLAEIVLGLPFDDALESMITDPLNITTGTGVDYTPAVLERLASSYLDHGNVKAEFADIGFDNPSGGLYSTASNTTLMLQAMGALYAGDSTSDSAAALGLSPSVVRDFLKPTWIANDASFQQGTPFEMFLSEYDFLVRGKDGVIDGFNSYVGLVPELRLSVVMLFNGPADDLLALARAAFATLIPPLVDALAAVQPGPLPAANPSDYVGPYACSDPSLSGSVVLVNATVLKLDTPIAPFPLLLSAVPGAVDSFTLYVDPVTSSGASCSNLYSSNAYGYVTFLRGSNNELTGFVMPMITPGTNWTKI